MKKSSISEISKYLKIFVGIPLILGGMILQASFADSLQASQSSSSKIDLNFNSKFFKVDLSFLFTRKISDCRYSLGYYLDEDFIQPPDQNSGFKSKNKLGKNNISNLLGNLPGANLKSFKNVNSVFEDLKNADYQICKLETDKFLIAPKFSGTGEPLVALNVGEARDAIIEIPHPFFEAGVLEQGLNSFEKFSVRAVIVSGAHRCSGNEYSTCDGRTSACGSKSAYRDSDPAHNPKTLFHQFHEALADKYEESLVINLHGMSSNGASISNGTKLEASSKDPIGEIYLKLKNEFSNENITTCNRLSDAKSKYDDRHCGTTNVQGRYLNSSTDVCEESADHASGRFIHLEQSRNLRDNHSDKVLEVILSGL